MSRPDQADAAAAAGGRSLEQIAPCPVAPGMELLDAVDFARTTRQSVLTTIRGDGRPQLSNVFHHVFDDGIIRISITADRAKYHNLLREPWAALHVTREDFFAYVVLEGDGRAGAGRRHDRTTRRSTSWSCTTGRRSVSTRTGTPSGRRWSPNVARSSGSRPTAPTACWTSHPAAAPDPTSPPRAGARHRRAGGAGG